MNKRIISSVLALVMILSAMLTSCDGGSTADTTVNTENTPSTSEGTTVPGDDGSDNFAGTPAYTVDGDYIVVDGVKYPNNNNYNAGPLVAIDDLDRVLPKQEDTKVAITDGSRSVGIFYFLWMGEHGDAGIFDMNKIIEEGGMAARFPDYEGWGDYGDMHFWGEPLYGYYYSKDKWVMRKHIEELTNAGVDFLYFDTTNGYDYLNNAESIMKIISEMNEQGWDAPQVVFYTHTNAAQVIKKVYGSIYKKGLYEDTWYKIDGKPVIGATQADIKAAIGASNADFFTNKNPQWPNTPKEDNAWPWMSFFQWDDEVFYDNDGNPDAISVSVAQHCGTVRFSDSAMYKDISNHGRSYHNGRNHNDGKSYVYGYNFQDQWDQAIEKDVPHVLVTGWNEWVAQRQGDMNNRVVFVDTCTTEFSRDVEMMRGGYFDNYYMQLISNIRRYKGTAPTLIQNTRKKIDINGAFDQWNDILVTYSDMTGDTADRNSKSFGKKTLKDKSGRNDISKMKVVYDTKNAYFYVECAEAISEMNTDSTWMQLFINTDNAKTGWYGFDYIVNYKAKSANETTLAKCTSTDGSFAFEEAATVSYKIEGNKMMISVPLSELGITDYNKINFSFKWADSEDVINTMEQMYTSGDTAPHGRLNFVFQNCK